MSYEDYLSRVRGRVNVGRIATVRVVQVGIGTVGSAVAAELASCGVQDFCLVDGELLEEQNIARHELKRPYIGLNKANAMATHLVDSYPPHTLSVSAVARHVDGSMSDDELDVLLEDADVVVAATDDRRAQRRVAERALAHELPAVFPSLYENGGGEVFVSLGRSTPCLLCWEAFRPEDQALRAVSALRVETTSVVSLAVQLTLGLLDESSEFARLYARRRQDPTPTLFVISRPHSAVTFAHVERAPNCPMCQVAPARSRAGAVNRRAATAPAGRIETLLEDPVLVLGGVAIAALVIVAASTGNIVAVATLSVVSALWPYFVLHPQRGAIVSWALEHDFVVLVGALINLGLLVFAIATSDDRAILATALAFAGSSTMLCSRV